MRRVLLAAALLALVATAVAKSQSPAEKRTIYWQQKLIKELPMGSSRSAIFRWISRNRASIATSPSDGQLRIRLEYVPVPKSRFSSSTVASICSGTELFAAVELDASDRLYSFQMQSLGDCL